MLPRGTGTADSRSFTGLVGGSFFVAFGQRLPEPSLLPTEHNLVVKLSAGAGRGIGRRVKVPDSSILGRANTARIYLDKSVEEDTKKKIGLKV